MRREGVEGDFWHEFPPPSPSSLYLLGAHLSLSWWKQGWGTRDRGVEGVAHVAQATKGWGGVGRRKRRGGRSWGKKLGKKSPIKKTDNQENNDLRRLRKISDATRRSGMKQFQFGESFTGMYARQFSKK